ncbi:hypothetical protein P171DRAFT_169080 [Karstenula rhodostoma CBS 690.94]|uniref:Uncharacterized protein n=1 Tax=Karstenula rhodostoma CBS 690.94 TaxID=1392251 RepID=A0A9P4P4G8_9PLEO|nr:hypothetical protein P171DRAFT_169080 [Karstenula rhodostoma CBS 690.94]
MEGQPPGPSSSSQPRRKRRRLSSPPSTNASKIPKSDHSIQSTPPGQNWPSPASAHTSISTVKEFEDRVTSPAPSLSSQSINLENEDAFSFALFDFDTLAGTFPFDSLGYSDDISTLTDPLIPMNYDPTPFSWTPRTTLASFSQLSPSVPTAPVASLPSINYVYPASHLPDSSLQQQTWQTQREMTRNPGSNKRGFTCPVRQAQVWRGDSEFSCSASPFDTMAEVRRHVERARHISFLKLCPTCNEHVMDKTDFENQHGQQGNKCTNPQKQARGIEAMQAQWWQLYHLVNSRTTNDTNIKRIVSPPSVASLVESSNGPSEAGDKTLGKNQDRSSMN